MVVGFSSKRVPCLISVSSSSIGSFFIVGVLLVSLLMIGNTGGFKLLVDWMFW